MKFKIIGAVCLILILSVIYVIFNKEGSQTSSNTESQPTEQTSNYSGLGK